MSSSSAQSELTLLKRQQDFSISAFQWGGVECKIKNMHHHFHCACIQVVANDHRNTIVTHTLIMKRTPHYVKVEKYQKVFQIVVPYSNNQRKKNGPTFSTFLWPKKGTFFKLGSMILGCHNFNCLLIFLKLRRIWKLLLTFYHLHVCTYFKGNLTDFMHTYELDNNERNYIF